MVLFVHIRQQSANKRRLKLLVCSKKSMYSRFLGHPADSFFIKQKRAYRPYDHCGHPQPIVYILRGQEENPTHNQCYRYVS